MKTKFLIFISFALLLFFQERLLVAQSKKAKASFTTESYDFGKIKEADGPVSYNFEFTNIGAEPLVIKNVVASCGCTSPNWPKQPIVPGAKGTITVTYNPAGRPGRFEKTITITSNADPEIQVLKITGDVIPKEPTIEDKYPNSIDDLRLKSLQIAFNNISPTDKVTQSVEVYNSTDSPMKVSFSDVPGFLTVKITPEELQPQGKGIITVTYDAAAKNDWGFVFDRFGVVINGKLSKNRLAVSANIQDDFSKLTEAQRLNAPKIEVDNLEFNFGTIKQGEKVSHEFILRNTGKSDLIIRKVTASCGCTVANVKSKTIKPGENTTITAVFNSVGRSGNQSKAITVITNDPANQRLVLWIKGNIVIQ